MPTLGTSGWFGLLTLPLLALRITLVRKKIPPKTMAICSRLRGELNLHDPQLNLNFPWPAGLWRVGWVFSLRCCRSARGQRRVRPHLGGSAAQATLGFRVACRPARTRRLDLHCLDKVAHSEAMFTETIGIWAFNGAWMRRAGSVAECRFCHLGSSVISALALIQARAALIARARSVSPPVPRPNISVPGTTSSGAAK